MHVTILVPKFPNILQTYIVNTIAGLKKAGTDINIIAREPAPYDVLPQKYNEHKLLDSTTHINLDGKCNIASATLKLPLWRPAYYKLLWKLVNSDLITKFGFFYFIKSAIFIQVLLRDKIDIIHSHSFFTSYDYLFLKSVFNIPFVATFHGHVPNTAKKLDSAKTQMVLEEIDTFYVNTQFSRQELMDIGCPKEKIKIIPQATDIDGYPFSDKVINTDTGPQLLTVGRLSIEKGHQYALQAFALLSSHYPAMKYHIVGDGPEKKNLIALSNKLGIENKVVFHGILIGQSLNEMYDHCQVFILPSIDLKNGFLIETQGVVIQEAQASGLAVIASATGGIPNIINDGITGLLFQEENSEELASKIKHLINSPDEFSRLCKSGRQDVVDRFGIDIISSQLIATYEKILTR